MISIKDGREKLYQWDTNRYVTVPTECSSVHFSNKILGRSIDVPVIDGEARIPDVLLQVDKCLHVWAFVGSAADGYTKISKVFDVEKRNKPADYFFTQEEYTNLSEVLERVEELESKVSDESIANAVEDYLTENPVEVPVLSVNDMVGDVQLSAEDVGALSEDDLDEAIDKALLEAKESGEFKGENGDKGDKGDQGEKGEKGDAGAPGYTPVKGVDYFDGANGKDGRDGQDGYTPIKGVDYFDGQDGKDGYTPVKGIDYFDGVDGKDGANGADGKTAYQYAQEGGYTGNETEFAEKLAVEPLIGTTEEITPEQVKEALEAGRSITLTHTHESYGTFEFNSFAYAQSFNEVYSSTIVNYSGFDRLCIIVRGFVKNESWQVLGNIFANKQDIPTELPNPYSLAINNKLYTGSKNVDYTDTINDMIDAKIPEVKECPTVLPNPNKLILIGAVNAQYDGSEEITVTIPAGGEANTETVLSDNLFDKSTAVNGKVFYYSSSGLTLTDSDWSYYAYVPLRGAGTYRTKWNNSQHSSTGSRVGITREDNSWLQTINGTLTETDSAYAYDMEFVVTQTMIDNGAAKIAFDCTPITLDTVMIVKDRTYPDEYIPYGYIEVATDSGKKQDNVLCEKTAVFLGDSICAGTTVEGEFYNYGWAGLIGKENLMTWKNYGMNGGTVTELEAVQPSRWLTTQVDNAIAEYPNADYVIFEGGCNDADQMQNARLGTVSSDYATFDTSTFSGAFEALVLKLITAFPNAKIGYIIPQKMYVVNDHSATGHVHRQFFDRAIEICEKWGVPYVDLWKTSPLNPKLNVFYNGTEGDATNFYHDGQHLTLKGYQHITPAIEAWMRTL